MSFNDLMCKHREQCEANVVGMQNWNFATTTTTPFFLFSVLAFAIVNDELGEPSAFSDFRNFFKALRSERIRACLEPHAMRACTGRAIGLW